jgi:DNA ligase-associated metallophosphoesterase
VFESHDYYLKGQHFILDSRKCIFWEDESILIVSDLHLGKSQHFRKSGIAIPLEVDLDNYERLKQIIEVYLPDQVYFLGDLFHSDKNNSWHYFKEVLLSFPGVDFILIRGNHDILDQESYSDLGMLVVEEVEKGPFIFTHIPLLEPVEYLYNISGHIHPGFKLRGKGRQTITLPCYHFNDKVGFIPAFGNFTGNMKVKDNNADIFIIYGNKVKGIKSLTTI